MYACMFVYFPVYFFTLCCFGVINDWLKVETSTSNVVAAVTCIHNPRCLGVAVLLTAKRCCSLSRRSL